MQYHKPVLTKEILSTLKIESGKKYIDATLGDGGHTIEMLKLGAIVLGIDYSEISLTNAKARIKHLNLEQNFYSEIGNFKDIQEIAEKHKFTAVDGILFDLGYSSTQLDEIEGLSFQKNAELDMRLDKTLGVKAKDLVTALSAKQLEKLFLEFGEESYAKRYAEAIVNARTLNEIQTTKDLSKIIVDVAPSVYGRKRIHPATKVFQALRIVVNDELENLKSALPRAAHLLKLPGGRMGIISFHSLEDRMVKKFGQHARLSLKEVNEELIVPSAEEINKNPRSRSAKLRVYERYK